MSIPKSFIDQVLDQTDIVDVVGRRVQLNKKGDSFSAAIASDGAYGVPEGLMCGYPLFTLPDGTIEIKRDLVMSEFAKQKFQISIDELESEREAVKHLLK